ncbi:hypothetical protein COZ60_03070, partial [Candidatus Bathyarchaeota archaeon CG_4_8_14_3_um_filter_42_8]
MAPFTTQPKHYMKRGCNTVRTRCIVFVDQLRAKGFEYELPLEKAKELFNEILGVYDRTTVKAYFGTLPGRWTRKFKRWAKYASGTQSSKDIELSQDVPKTKGYLEKLGLVSYERHGRVWFMVLENLQIVPIIMKANSSKDKISLTPIHKLNVERFEGKPLASAVERGNGCPTTTPIINNNNLQCEREISRLPLEAYQSIPSMPTVTLEELTILNAEPIDSEPDRAKVTWKEQK